MPGRYLITGGLVVTLDDSLGELENGAILIEDGVIKAVGRSEDIPADGAEVIDATEGVVIPGMVDTHRHATLSLARGISVDETVWPMLFNTYFPLVPLIGIEEVRTSALVSALEALESGITTINEPSESFASAGYAEAGLQSFKKSGIRTLYSFGMHQTSYGDLLAGKASWEARLEHARKLIQEYSQDELIRVGLHLSQPGTVPITWLRDEIEFAHNQGVFCCSHSNCVRGSDVSRDLDVRAEMGCMLPGHLYIHCPSLTDHDMGLIAKTGGKLAFATDSNIQTGMGYPPLRMALAHGLKPSLSTDSAMTAPTDMLSTMRLQLQAQRGQDHHAIHLTSRPSTNMGFVTRDALIWGTRNGAEALGLGDKIGTLTPGKRADVVIITNKRRISPSVHPLGTAMLHSSPADVDLVMVDGKIMKRDGHMVGVDMEKIRVRARQDSRRILENLERRNSEVGLLKAEDIIPMMEQAQRACFAYGRTADLAAATFENDEVYEFLEGVCQRYGAGFWKPGAGIIHQIVLENYAYPGGLMIGTDSHTPNAGGIGMAAIGVGGAYAVDVMSGLAWELKTPKVIGVNLTGKLSNWASPKDVILKLTGELTVKGATGAVKNIWMTEFKLYHVRVWVSTICNMGAETGATTSMFPYTDAMGKYLDATGRSDIRKASSSWQNLLSADQGAEYDQIINIDLSTLEPYINGPSTPDFATPLTRFKDVVTESNWDKQISAGLIGSCTNSSFEDISRTADLAKQAMEAGLKPQAPLYLSPGSEATYATLEQARVLEVFSQAGTTLLANACGPCCGSWNRQDVPNGQNNSIVTSYNRNFTGRLDSNPATKIFLASPEIVIAKTFAGSLDFNPAQDAIDIPNGDFRFNPPPQVDLPSNGYREVDSGYVAPPADRSQLQVNISPFSDRIQRLQPFKAWDGRDYEDLAILIKVEGKCTTDHITPAGPWFRYRGHLENISNNTLIGAVNAENKRVNSVVNVFTGDAAGVPETARDYVSLAGVLLSALEHVWATEYATPPGISEQGPNREWSQALEGTRQLVGTSHATRWLPGSLLESS
ncbi:hypothetical protein BKA66DRAFT_567009 [Pyrenochaeta sp. MPI-SDFR-AT-0127]|nr:hypothetical protein BKA66DRAFT_567009 [Pyrenochaeta sp. MPI-SDFR-AT-0127]